jgi:predicted GNAT superfamily acetyltransferase
MGEWEQAAAAALRAAQKSGVEIRDLSEPAELRAVHALYRGIWGSGSADSPVSYEQLRAMAHTGNYTAGAFLDGEMVGACVGFFGAPPGRVLHSHVAGVIDGARARSVGYALKLHQRAWALARGLREVTWTFDPLVRRNAYFNLVKLAARPREYLVDFYGDLTDAVNAGQGSDRLLIVWDLTAPEVVAACDGNRAEADTGAVPPALTVSPAGRPVSVRVTAPTVRVPVPEDVEAIRRSDPDLARQWRAAVRDLLHGLMAGGGRVVGFHRTGGYLVEKWSPPKLARAETWETREMPDTRETLVIRETREEKS